MIKHPEGGFYKETYRSAQKIDQEDKDKLFPSGRAYSTAIYYLLGTGDISRFHRIQSDEIWHYYDGNTSVVIPYFDLEGGLQLPVLGLGENENTQIIIPQNCWFGAFLQSEGYVLCGCTVSPGFDFADFEMGSRENLMNLYSHSREWVEKLTD